MSNSSSAEQRFWQAREHFDEVRAGAYTLGLHAIPGADSMRGAANLLRSSSQLLRIGVQSDQKQRCADSSELSRLLVQAAIDLLIAASEIVDENTSDIRAE